MKKLLLFLVSISLFNVTIVYSQDTLKSILDNSFGRLMDMSKVNTGYLLNKGFVFGCDNVTSHYQNSPKEEFYSSPDNWRYYYEFFRLSGDRSNNQISKFNFIELQDNYYSASKDTVPIGILAYNANYMNSSDFESLKVGNYVSVSGLNTCKAVVVSPLKEKFYTSKVTFQLNDKFIHSNMLSSITAVSVNFSNGEGWKFYPMNNQFISVDFGGVGEKHLSFRLHAGRDTLFASSKINILQTDYILPSDTFNVLPVSTLSGLRMGNESNLRSTGNISSGGATGTIAIFLGCDGVFDKPVILAEGFDPDNSMGINELYNEYKDIRTDDYDLVILNYGNGGAYIESNVNVFKEAIKKVNSLKRGTFESVVVGISMSGLIARIGLKELENEGYDHFVGTFVSFDSPHKGANVPVGLQHFGDDILNYPVAEIVNLFGFVPELKVLQKARDADAGKQMLVNQRLGVSLQAFLDLQAKLRNIGYPNNCYNVALIDGNKNAEQQIPTNNYSQGDEIFYSVGVLGLVNWEFRVKTHKTNGLDMVSRTAIFAPVIGQPYAYDKITYTNYTDMPPYDIAPGGNQNQHKEFQHSFSAFSTTNGRDYFCFVPSSSSLDLSTNYSGYNYYNHLFYFNESSTNPNQKRAGLISNNITPFDDIFANESGIYPGFNNLPHVSRSLPSEFGVLKQVHLERSSVKLQKRNIVGSRTYEATNSIIVGLSAGRTGSRNGEVNLTSGKDVEFRVPSGGYTQLVGFNSNGANVSITPGTVVLCNQGSNEFPLSPNPIISGPTSVCYRGGGRGGVTYSPSFIFSVANLSSYSTISRRVTWVVSPNPSGSSTDLKVNGDVLNLSAYRDFAIRGKKTYTITCEIETSDIVSSSRTFQISGACPVREADPLESEVEEDMALEGISNAIIDSYQLNIYPNPTNDYLYIRYKASDLKPLKTKVFSLLGAMELDFEDKVEESGMLIRKYNTSDLSPGVYILNIILGEKTISQRFTVVK